MSTPTLLPLLRAPDTPASTHAVRSTLAILAALAILMLPACSFRTRQYSNFLSDSGVVQDSDDTRQSAFEVSEEMDRLTVELSARGRSGEASWELRDPRGALRWTQLLGGTGEFEQLIELDPAPGTWSLKRRFTGFSGWHRLRFSAVGGQALSVTISADAEAPEEAR